MIVIGSRAGPRSDELQDGGRIRVVIADDTYLVTRSARADPHPGRRHRGGAHLRRSRLADRRDRGGRPDVVLTDIRMPPTGTDEGIQVARRAAQTHPEIGVVVLSQFVDPEYVLALLESGSARPSLPAQGARQRPAASSRARSRPWRRRVGDRPQGDRGAVQAHATTPRLPLRDLTPRERDVLAELAQGKSNGAIAESLVLTKRAVEKHINAIFTKLEPGRARRRQPAREGRAAVSSRARTAPRPSVARRRARGRVSAPRCAVPVGRARCRTMNVPPVASTRSRSPCSPRSLRSTAPPTPSSSHLEHQARGVHVGADRDHRSVGVSLRVGHRLENHVVGGRLRGLVEADVRKLDQLDRRGGPRGDDLSTALARPNRRSAAGWMPWTSSRSSSIATSSSACADSNEAAAVSGCSLRPCRRPTRGEPRARRGAAARRRGGRAPGACARRRLRARCAFATPARFATAPPARTPARPRHSADSDVTARYICVSSTPRLSGWKANGPR